MRILISGEAPFGHTGYAVINGYLANIFQAMGHHVDFYAWANVMGGSLKAGECTFYPHVGDMGGNVQFVVEAAEADILFSLQDLWPLPHDFGDKLKDIPWIAYFPVDAEPLMDAIAHHARNATYPVVYSKYGARVVEKAEINHYYIPHGIDVSLFKPLVKSEEEKQQLRITAGFPEDAFIISMVASNLGMPSRKAIPEVMEAFSIFQQRHNEALLYLHTNIHPQDKGGYPLLLLAQRLGIPPNSFKHVHQLNYAMGMPPHYIATVYNLSDVLMSPSMGEGFGLPIAEAQACGCPVITQDFSSMSELTMNGIAVPKGQRFWRAPCDYQYIPRIDDIVEALEVIYARTEEEKSTFAEIGIDFIRANYSWKFVIDNYWSPFMKHVESQFINHSNGQGLQATAKDTTSQERLKVDKS